MNTNDAKEYLARREIPQLFESLLTGLMYHRPDDPIDYLEGCLKKVRELGGPDKVRWDTFVGQEKKSLPPINGGQSRRSLFRNVMPNSSPNFPYRRYERLPPISQFSIESDSDLSETAELIEEYEVFDPSRPRPKVILVIGGPGSGKGTQCLKIAERYGFQYVSVGELLRKKMIHNATSNRKWSLIAKIITNGELAPQETTITEIKQKIMKIPDANGIVIDGFPRDVGQALSFEDQICTPDLVLFLACTNHRLKERLHKRAEQQGRPDDNPKAIDRRLTNFKQNTIPLVKYFQERGLIVTLDADREEEEVFCDISMTLDNKLSPSQETAAGDPSEQDVNVLAESRKMVDMACKEDEDEEEEELLYGEGTGESFFTEPPKKPKVIFLMGAPGSGKTVQCEHMEAKLGLRRVVLAELLRKEVQAPTDRGRHLRDVLERGECLPEAAMMDVLCEAVAALLHQARGVVVSGFPVDVRQAQQYEAKMGEPTAVLLLSCSTPQSRQRSASDGDNAASLREDSFWGHAHPVLEHYRHRNLLHTIDAERSPDEVFAQICQVMETSCHTS
ncbi:adenylate kinase isoenzyme 5 isoform X2 [Dunckerocampus dactyliophorus]|uniref:adenylate kinase isoenzyme 5 isoform X2 n=1 Tax=Dunckerocampus dactyliophorus TaxID=161453 RepID=UPI0024053A28|nr:adenylate kinase isoenzyme 5 isoform X2 [Dunckerocampus dactyliophorus]